MCSYTVAYGVPVYLYTCVLTTELLATEHVTHVFIIRTMFCSRHNVQVSSLSGLLLFA